MLQIYTAEHRIVTNMAVAAIAFVLIGFFALPTAITLYVISRLEKQTPNKWTIIALALESDLNRGFKG